LAVNGRYRLTQYVNDVSQNHDLLLLGDKLKEWMLILVELGSDGTEMIVAYFKVIPENKCFTPTPHLLCEMSR